MARRKQQVLQEVLTNQEEWDNFMSRAGLSIIDCHQGWCGPTKPVIGLFKRVKTELGSEVLSFATADCDSIDSLEQYRDNCQPCFHFYSAGQLCAIIRGCDAPQLEMLIREKTALEEAIVRGEAERGMFVDPELENQVTGVIDILVYYVTIHFALTPNQVDNTDDAGAATTTDGKHFGEHHVAKLVTVALIKPDLTSNNEKMEEILAKIEDHGLEIVADEEKLLSVDEVAELYAHRAEDEKFNELIEFMTSGPVRALGLTKGDTGDGVIDLWRDVIGPYDPDEAKKQGADTIRARFGSSTISNAVHGSSSESDAARELAFFFPNFTPPRAVMPQSVRAAMDSDMTNLDDVFPVTTGPERTVTIIRPEALKAHREQILDEIEEAGFQIVRQKEISLTREQAEQLYEAQKDEEHFEALIQHMTSGPSLVLCLARDNAIAAWREKLGPKENAAETAPDTIRAKYSVGSFNAAHASTSDLDVEREEKLLFTTSTVALIKPDAAEKSDDIVKQLEGCGFTIKETRDVELTGEIAAAIYAGKKGEPFFDELVGHMTSGTCKVLVLSDIDAVDKLRNIVGAPDPVAAQADAPDSIRAKFASSIIANAIHAPSDENDVQLHYQLLLN